MQIDVKLDANGFLPDEYAKFAPEAYRVAGLPLTNFPIQISDVPAGTQTLAVELIDYDAVPVGGFPWIHWLAANLPVGNIPENVGNTDVAYSKGMNSTWHDTKDAPLVNQSYIGPMPPDKTHDYTLYVFAVDTKLPLTDGFFLSDFRRAIKGHVLAEVELDLPARSE
ncbi:MAG: YbhB/YbcL family Raf kinase inhibitor-like protein [Lactobacillaceae bacterium]|jgi:Raf kinase inhibitor-like YbhB/YbcL family protein|nr:YbhB/YbcL family Raf kinase inhibitor-like protein [Lactobacillaceae bacterium]